MEQETCISTSMTKLHLISLHYIYVVYPLLLICITWVCIELHARNFRLVVYPWKPFHKCFAKVRRNWSASDSIIHAYATSILLSWTSLIYVVCVTFLSTDIYNINGTVIRTGLVYAPTIKRFSPQHLPYAMPAILLFFFGICPTLFLCLYLTRLFRKCFKVHPKVQLLFKTFADAFQCCYKDGLNGNYDFRILSSAPMVLSITSFAIINFFYNIQDFNVEVSSRSNSLVYLLFSFAVAYVRPFKSLYMNFSFSFHFIIGCLLQEIAFMEYESQFPSYYLAVSYTILSLLPHVFALATIVYHLLHHIRCVRTVFTIMSEKISVILCGAPDVTESLQNSYAYRTLPPIL